MPLVCLFKRVGAALAASLVLGSACHAVTIIRVDGKGADASGAKASSSTASPVVATLQEAQALVRKRRAQQPGEDVRVLIAPGVFRLKAPLVFSPEDGGNKDAFVSYEAEKPGTVIISGGLEIDQATLKSEGNRWTAPLPGAAEHLLKDGSTELFVGGRRAVLAREPNRDKFFFVRGPSGKAAEKDEIEADAQVGKWFSGLSARDKERAVLHLYQSWSTGRHAIRSVSADGRISFSPEAAWPALHFGSSQRFYLENIAAALDAPAEWIKDGSTIRYVGDGATRQPGPFVLTYLPQLLVVKGSVQQSVRNLRFLGLTFEYAASPLNRHTYADVQAAVKVGAAIEVDHAVDFSLRQCSIRRVGGYGVWLREGVVGGRVEGCEMSDLGAGGVKVGEAEPKSNAATERNVVDGNRIRDTGQAFPGAVAVWVGRSSDNRVTGNDISDTSYSGISVGWQWRAGASSARGNLISHNTLVNIGQGDMSDLGAIYTLGPSPQTVISHNLIRAVSAYEGYGPGGWGIYLDSESGSITVSRNVIVDTESGALFLNFGDDNKVESNVFAGGDGPEISIGRKRERLGLLARGNYIFLGKGKGVAVGDFVSPPQAQLSGNFIVSANDSAQNMRDKGGKACVLGACLPTAGRLIAAAGVRDVKAELVNPNVLEAVNGVISAAGAGAQASARTKGPSSEARATSVAAAVKPVARRESAPPIPLDAQFRSLRPGDPLPAILKYGISDQVDAFDLVKGVDGGTCLRMKDSPSLRFKHEPYVFSRLNFLNGRVRSRVVLSVDAASEMIVEWRDSDRPGYRVGPSFSISDGTLFVAGRKLSAVPLHKKVEYTASTTLNQDKSWSLRVEADGKLVHESTLSGLPANFGKLAWIGVISNGSSESSPCLYALSVDQHP